jgi:hypothetical protein
MQVAGVHLEVNSHVLLGINLSIHALTYLSACLMHVSVYLVLVSIYHVAAKKSLCSPGVHGIMQTAVTDSLRHYNFSLLPIEVPFCFRHNPEGFKLHLFRSKPCPRVRPGCGCLPINRQNNCAGMKQINPQHN